MAGQAWPSQLVRIGSVATHRPRLRFMPRRQLAVRAAPPLPEDFIGKVFHRDKGDRKLYEAKREQYAYSSHSDESSMNPMAIISPSSDDHGADEDVLKAIAYALEAGVKIAVRTGGHQYSGASSTAGDNIQLDVSNSYKGIHWNTATGILTTGISRSLGALNQKLGQLKLFVPHGQCAHVHVGGHAQTGGYGLPARAFGLFGDHITAIRMITADGVDKNTGKACGQARWYHRDATDSDERDLFYAVLGGGPGNFGVLTDIKLKPHQDSDHPHSVGARYFALHNAHDSTRFAELLDKLAGMANDTELPADYDLCVTVMSGGKQVLYDMGMDSAWHAEDFDNQVGDAVREEVKKETEKAVNDRARMAGGKIEAGDMIEAVLAPYGVPQEQIKALRSEWAGTTANEDASRALADETGDMSAMWDPNFLDGLIGALKDHVTVIIVFAEWANVDGEQGKADAEDGKKWLRSLPHFPWDKPQPLQMSRLTPKWVFPIAREFDLPYVKRTYVTNSTSLGDAWKKKTIEQVNSLVTKRGDGCRIVIQIQHFGGKRSKFSTNDMDEPQRTAYSWRRDTTVVQVMDAFYDDNMPKAKQIALDWQAQNDRIFAKEDGVFGSASRRRLLWGSYHTKPEERNMGNVWDMYHESEEKYKRLCKIKQRVDPHNIFTPNEFTVDYPPSSQ